MTPPTVPTCEVGPSPEFPVTPWFTACEPGAQDAWARPASGCMTREQQNKMGEFRALYLKWQEAQAVCAAGVGVEPDP